MSDLTSPLGFKAPGNGKKKKPFGVVASVAVLAVAAVIALWVIVVENPHGGEPVAVVKIQDLESGIGRDEVTVVGVKSGAGEILPPIDLAAERDALDAQAAETPADEPGSSVGQLGAGSRPLPTAPLPDLVQEGNHGPLPRIAGDGTRPMDAYSRPVPGFVGAAPKIAIVVGGLGLSQTSTQEALRLLPPDVTLAFAPYGSSLGRWVTSARQSGHEILLQIPLEPFDYPDNDPGPHTLLTNAGAEKNLDNLHWLLSRISTYVGVMGYMGARFTADGTALDPLMSELAGRGLMYVDDGTSSRSRSATVATQKSAAFASADLVIDQVASKGDIVGRLAQLEQIARTRGIAVGVASALPVSIQEIGEWAKTLEPRGITLVPITATTPKS